MANNNVIARYSIGLDADTSQLRQSVNEAVSSLQKIGLDNHLDASLKDASQSALELSQHLRSAFNQDTGRLDLTTFNESLKRSNKTLTEYANDLTKLGARGEEAFMRVAKAVTSAELPIKRTSKLLDNLWITMKNTMRWQLTSSMLNGFMGAVQTAYGYTKNLNESLNNIRIVTHKSVEEMAVFAKEANRAAQELNTTTVDYTDASLIYYQQGLSDEEVLKRTETTVRLANVSRQSAEEVSSQMTAIWNNFADGSKSLEYYADVITALGAATAASSEEIANGMQKFAAVADTVGLSYEYSAAALATIVAATRQSEDTVGTGLRTILARIESLNLGETLEDGVTLTKYTEALDKAGISVLDTNNQLKEADDILDSIASKWETMTETQQQSLAYTVGGVRQYANLIALFDNWDDMTKNINIAKNSSGELGIQAEIYAESWEAARDRVRAAAENIYDSFINEDFYIAADNAVTPLLNGIATIADAMGGLKGVVLTLVPLMMSLYGDKMVNGLQNMAVNMGLLTGFEQLRARAIQKEVADAAAMNDAQDGHVHLMQEEVRLRGIINEHWDSLTEQQRKLVELDKEDLMLLKQRADLSFTNADKFREDAGEYRLTSEFNRRDRNTWLQDVRNVENDANSRGVTLHFNVDATDADRTLRNINDRIAECADEIDSFRTKKNAIDAVLNGKDKTAREWKELAAQIGMAQDQIDRMGKSGYAKGQYSKDIIAHAEGIRDTANAAQQELEELRNAAEAVGANPTAIQRYITALENERNAARAAGQDTEELTRRINEQKLRLEEAGAATMGWSQRVVQAGQVVSGIAMGVNSLAGIWRVATDEQMSAGDRFLGIISSLAGALSAYAMVHNAVATATKCSSAAMAVNNAIMIASNGVVKAVDGAEKKSIITKIAVALATKKQAKATTDLAKAQIAANATMGAFAIVALGVVAAVAAIAGVIALVVNAYNADADAAKSAAEKAKELGEAYEKTRDAAEQLKTSISDYSKAKDELANLEKGTMEYREALIKANEKALELLNTYEGIAQYASRTDDGLIVISQEGLDEILEQQMQAVEQSQLRYVEGQMRSTQAQEKSDITDFARSQKISREFADDLLNEIAGYLDKNNSTELIAKDLDNLDSFKSATDEVQNSILNNISAYSKMGNQLNETRQAQKVLAETCAEASYKIYNSTNDGNGNSSSDSRVQRVERNLYTTFDTNFRLSSSEIEKAKNDYIDNRMSEIYDEYVTNGAPLGALIAGDVMRYSGSGGNRDNAKAYAGLMGWDTEKLDFERDFLETFTGDGRWQFYDKNGKAIDGKVEFDDLMDLLAAEVERQEEAARLSIDVPEILSNIDSVLRALDFGENEGAFDNLLLSGAVGKFNLEKSGMSQDQAQNFLDNWNDIEAQFNGFDATTGFWEKQGFNDAETYLNALRQWLRSRASMSDGEALGLDVINPMQKNIRASIDDMMSGKLTSENADDNEAYTNLKNRLEELVTLFPELTVDAQTFNNKGLIGTQEWAQAAFNLEQRINNLKLDNLIKEAKKTDDVLQSMLAQPIAPEIILQPEGFENKLKELINKDYEINVELHAQAEDAFKSFETASQNLAAQAQKIGEGYVVAASDIRELNNAFPGIIQNMEIVGDGTVRLNETIVKAAMNSANAEIAASAQSTLEQLTNQATVLRSKQAAYQSMYEAAIALASGEGDAAEHSATIQKGFDDIEAANNQALTDTKTDNAELVATDSNTQAGIMAANWDSAYQSAANSAVAFAQTAVSAAKAAQSGELGDLQKGDFGVTYHGNNGQSSEAAKLAELKDATANASTDDDWLALAQSFQQAADIFGSQANDIEGMIAAIGAGTVDLSHLLMNTGSDDGKGGSDDPKDIKLTEKDEVVDRYHKINDAIDNVSRATDKLSKKTDRLYGADKIKAMEQEAKLLRQQAEYLAIKTKEAQGYLSTDKENLLNVAKGLGLNVEIDTDTGDILNLQQLQESLYNTLHGYQLIQSSLTSGTAQEEFAKATLDPFNKQLEAFKKAVSKYEETKELIQDLDEDRAEKLYEAADRELEAINLKAEVYIEIKNAVDAAREFGRTVAEAVGDALSHGKASMGFDVAAAQSDIAGLNKEIEHYIELSNRLSQALDEDSRQDIIDSMLESQDTIIGYGESLVDLELAFRERFPEAIDAAKDRFAEFTDTLDHNASILQSIKEIYELVGVKPTDKKIQDAMATEADNAIERARTNTEAAKVFKERLDKAEAALNAPGAPTEGFEYERLKANYDAALAAYREFEEARYESAQEALQALRDLYLVQIEAAAEDFDKAVSNGVGLDWMEQRYDRYVTENERVLDAVNTAYEKQTWLNKLQKDIDNSQNAVYKNRLKALQDEIDLREEANGLSQYDLDILNAKYAMLQAEMALEDARNNKNEMRLVRDSQGNWNYQYTANQDDIAAAEQEVLDAQNEYYNIAKNQTKELTSEILATKKEFKEAVIEIYNDATLSAEERNAKIKEIQEYYNGQLSFLYDELGIAMDDMTTAGEESITDYESTYETKMLEMAGDLETFQTQAEELIGKCNESMGSYQSKVEEVEEATDKKFGDMTKDVEAVNSELDKMPGKLDAAATKMRNEFATLDTEAEKWQGIADAIANAIEQAQKYSEQIALEANEAAGDPLGIGDSDNNNSDTTPTPTPTPTPAPTSQSDTGAGSGTGGGKSSISHSELVDLVYGMGIGKYSNGYARRVAVEKGYPGMYDDAQAILNEAINSDNWNYNHNGNKWKKTIDALVSKYGYASGGYTGEFKDAKLAFLHEKELVLNKSDTANILTAVSAIRTLGPSLFGQIEQILDGNARAAMALMGERMSAPTRGAADKGVLEQRVTIEHVEFPNVTSSDEILKAFESLENDAAQWAERKVD